MNLLKHKCKKFSVLILILSLGFTQTVFPNKIDELKTDKQVNEFVKLMNPDFSNDKYGRFEVRNTDLISKDLKCNGIFKNWNIKNWEKADITNDGLTDLIFIAYWYDYISYAFIDLGNNKFKLFRFSKNSFENCTLIKPIKINSQNFLKIFRKNSERDTTQLKTLNYATITTTDTLVYKFNGFIELNQPTKNYKNIESIEIKTSYCFGDCPSFILKLNKNGYANFEGIGYVKSKGTSTKKLSSKIFKDIAELANYINIENLKNNYAVNWTDDQTSILKVTFKDETTKVIRDYGLQGTFGLSAIYSKMISLGVGWNALPN